jgi:predicted protein tyrosine phosphatase
VVKEKVCHVLFICGRNQLRSPTAEQVFSRWDGIEVASAGLDPVSREPVTPELLEWADVIFVMERSHRNKLAKKFRRYLKDQRVIVLGIPDEYEYMDPELIRLFESHVPSHLGMAAKGKV